MNNCYFCKETLKDIWPEGIDKTETKTECCSRYYCEKHLNDLFECPSCEKAYCYAIDDICDANNFDKCSKCFGSFCLSCFSKLSTEDGNYMDAVCKKCADQ